MPIDFRPAQLFAKNATPQNLRKIGLDSKTLATTTTSRGTPLGKAQDATTKAVSKGIGTTDTSYSNEPYNKITSLADELYQQTGELNKIGDKADADYARRMAQSGQTFLNSLKSSAASYKPQIQNLMNQAQGQADNARQTYQTSLQPKLTSMLDADYREAYGVNGVGGAMSLAEAGNPNNAIQSAIRDMYNTQAQNVGRQGQQSSALLGALGAQNAASAFGSVGAPMSVGQQQALYAASQNQAGQAYARTQKEMQNLRAQGIDRGFTESDLQYQRGERAKGRAKDAASQLSDEERKFQADQAALRGEIGAGAADLLGIDSSLAGSQRDYSDLMANIGSTGAYNRMNRGLGREQNRFGNLSAVQYAQAQKDMAKSGQNAQILGGLISAGGSVLGGFLGGRGGGAASASPSPTPAPAQEYSAYGPYAQGYNAPEQRSYTPYFGQGRAYGR